MEHSNEGTRKFVLRINKFKTNNSLAKNFVLFGVRLKINID
jgi:hypothetical protein